MSGDKQDLLTLFSGEAYLLTDLQFFQEWSLRKHHVLCCFNDVSRSYMKDSRLRWKYLFLIFPVTESSKVLRRFQECLHENASDRNFRFGFERNHLRVLWKNLREKISSGSSSKMSASFNIRIHICIQYFYSMLIFKYFG